MYVCWNVYQHHDGEARRPPEGDPGGDDSPGRLVPADHHWGQAWWEEVLRIAEGHWIFRLGTLESQGGINSMDEQKKCN